MKLLLPLKYYDDAGRVKPSFALYMCIAYLSRSLLILVGSLTVRDNGSQLLAFFYPDKQYLYFNLAIALPAFLVVFLLGFREKIWKSNRCWLFSGIKPLLMFSVLADLGLHLLMAKLIYWQFSWIIALTTMLDVLCFYFFAKDKHTQIMLLDWHRSMPVSNPQDVAS